MILVGVFFTILRILSVMGKKLFIVTYLTLTKPQAFSEDAEETVSSYISLAETWCMFERVHSEGQPGHLCKMMKNEAY